MRHHLSHELRTLSGPVKRRVLDEAADELDRLNNLIIETVAQSSASYSDYRHELALRDAKIRELEQALHKESPL